VSSLRFHKKAKLIKTDEFSSVFNFRKRIFANYIAIHYQPNALVTARLGLVVGKKIAKNAVQRNYMRRVLRECFRLQQHDIPAVDLVIRVQKKFDQQHFSQLQQEFNEVIVKLKRRINPAADKRLLLKI
jgi:ribonuclease P protein component